MRKARQTRESAYVVPAEVDYADEFRRQISVEEFGQMVQRLYADIMSGKVALTSNMASLIFRYAMGEPAKQPERKRPDVIDSLISGVIADLGANHILLTDAGIADRLKPMSAGQEGADTVENE